MLGDESSYKLPDYSQFMLDLEDPETAIEFLLHLIGVGYIIEEIPKGIDIKELHPEDAVLLAKSYWGVYFLDEFPDYGEIQ